MRRQNEFSLKLKSVKVRGVLTGYDHQIPISDHTGGIGNIEPAGTEVGGLLQFEVEIICKP